MSNPTMLFKKDGSTLIDIGDFNTALLDWKIVDADDKKALSDAIHEGWSLTPAGALEIAPPQASEPEPESEPEQPVSVKAGLKRGK